MNYPPPIPGLLVAGLMLCGASALLAWAFVIRYFRTRWWATPEGRHLMRFTVVLAATLTATVLVAVLPFSAMFAALVQVVLFGAMTCELSVRNALLGQAQRAIRRAKKTSPPTDLHQKGTK